MPAVLTSPSVLRAAPAVARVLALGLLPVLGALAVLAADAAARAAAVLGVLMAVGLVVSLAAVKRRHEAELERVSARDRAWERSFTELRAATDELVRRRLPAVLEGGETPPAARRPGDPVLAGLFDEAVAAAVGAARRGAEREESLRLVVVALARRAQAAAHRVQAVSSLVAERYSDDPDLVEACMVIDHEAAQQGRHAQSLAVLCGEWPGQQWQDPLAFVDVVRSAAARITAFRRVEVTGDPDLAADAPVVEPLIHLLAEALANATQSSPPTSMVTVAVRAVERGVVVQIDDGGVGMDAHRLEEARKIASGERRVGLSGVGEIPQTGLPVIGHYARRHGLRVDLSHSPYGGIRVVVLVPEPLVRILEPAGAPAAAAPPEPPRPSVSPSPAPERPATTASGLPLRRRRRDRQDRPSPVPGPAAQSPEDAARWAGAFFTASGPRPADGGSEAPQNQDGAQER